MDMKTEEGRAAGLGIKGEPLYTGKQQCTAADVIKVCQTEQSRVRNGAVDFCTGSRRLGQNKIKFPNGEQRDHLPVLLYGWV